MNDDLMELYQEVIMEHNRHPRNYGVLAHANREASGFNPLCGDKIHLKLQVDNDHKITAAMFEGSGCAISIASASLLTEILQGKMVAEAYTLFEQFHELLTGHPTDIPLGKLAVFAGVSAFPARVKCATLAWHTLKAALLNNNAIVSTETGHE
ncbi:MAG: system FeS assembly protein NifU family [Gammaproteobacteria bacterium]|jgi:nitrogen fixation NifU-like protein|nr:system FeS assembly protein NifU family [Gammaproteobacteria bacterium]